ncbi:hypothetical protein G3I44_13600 [Halogeometricum borinquense]|uniref:Uncharacterized protein n=1 Tax=Halogeometricum borinquense TaxID=60847 RepID=A0A6C0UQK6_9EURY|nr:hypothetical protein [Halogeometricum borinquense]QIB75228.1 hypothetical protein G3I44_13600 [Halogeometricum borinquense]
MASKSKEIDEDRDNSNRKISRRGVLKGLGTALTVGAVGAGSAAAMTLDSVTVSDETMNAFTTDDESTYDYIVDASGSTGSYTTIQGVIDDIDSNSPSSAKKILVKSGTYSGVSVPTSFGDTSDPHIFHAENADVTMDDGGTPAIVVNGGGVVDFRGFTFANATSDLVVAQNQSSTQATLFFNYCDFSYAFDNDLTSAVSSPDYEPFGFDVTKCYWGTTTATEVGSLIDVVGASKSQVDPVLSDETSGSGDSTGGGYFDSNGDVVGLLALLGGGGYLWKKSKDGD